MLRSRRFALAAAVAVGLTLTACGDVSQTSAPGSSLPVVHLGAPTNAAEAGAAPAATGDKMMMPWGLITYIYDGEFPTLADTGSVYRFEAGTPDPARIQAIAAALGVEGEVRELPADQGGGWMVGPSDYSGPTVTVGADGMLSWWYNPSFSPVEGVACGEGGTVTVEGVPAPDVATETTAAPLVPSTDVPAETIPVDTVVVDPCMTPDPPVNVPDKATAEAKAKELMTQLGYDPAGYEFETYADEWSASVNAFLLVDGERSSVTMSFGYGGEGALTWAGGSLAELVKVGDYPLVSSQQGFDRLSDPSGAWQYGWGMYPMAVADTGVSEVARGAGVAGASGTATESAPAPADSAPVETVTVSASGDAAVAPMPCDPAADCVQPEPITVHLDGVRLGTTTIWDEDGTVWLLPAFVFHSTDGGEYSVLAVDAAYVDLPGVPPVDTVPVDTVPVDSTPVDTTPVDTVAPAPETVTPEQAAELVGLSEDEATKVAEERGWVVRVVRADGVDLPATADYVSNRVNVELTQGTVTAIVSIG